MLAVLRSSDGTTAEVDRAVLIGRAPSGQRSSARAPRLMTVPSPGHDISRTHLEVAPEGWHDRGHRPPLDQRYDPGPARRGGPTAAAAR